MIAKHWNRILNFRHDLDIAELEDSTIFVAKNFIQVLKNAEHELEQKELLNELILECIKHMKIMCTKGPSLQNLIVNTTGMLSSLKDVSSGKFGNVSPILELKCFQLIANLCVKNEWSQEKIWISMSDVVMAKFESDDNSYVNVSAMVVYNMVLSKMSQLNHQQIVKISLKHFKTFLETPANSLPDFVHILMDYLICKSSEALETYKQLEPEDQKTALYYIHDHIDDETNE